MSEEAEAIAPEDGLTGAEAQDQEQSTAAEDNSYQLITGEDPMLKTPDKFLMEDGSVDIDQLTKGYNNLEKLKSQKGFKAPDSVDGYELTTELPDGFEINEEAITDLKQFALDTGMSNEQLNGVFEKYSAELKEIQDQFAYDPEEAESHLKEVWGEESYDQNIELATTVAENLGDVLPMEDIEGNIPLIKVLAHFGAQMESDSAPSSQNTSASMDVQTEISELQNSPDYYTNESKQSRMRELLGKI